MLDVYDPAQVLAELRGYGFHLTVDEYGVVHGKRPGGNISLEMRDAILRLQMVNTEVAALLKAEEKQETLTGITPEEARRWGEKIKTGEYRLIGEVLYHRSTGLVDLIVERVKDG